MALSDREFRRVQVMERLASGAVRVREAAELLCLSERQVKRLAKRYRSGGAKALVHGNFARCSNHARSESERARVIELIRERYGGSAELGPGQRLGPTLVSEHLWDEEGIRLPVTTLTKWMKSEGLWSRRRKRSSHRRRRDRKQHFGELVQLDGSFHDWLEGRGPEGCMMTMTDDATSTQLSRLGEEETFWDAVQVLQAWIKEYGVPRAIYTDWKSLYHSPGAAGVERSQLSTQFGRVCSRLGIELIAASSPQAKGRVERTHGTNQDRLIKKLRLKGISTHAAVNEYLSSSYLAAHNERFARRPASSTDFHLPLERRVDTQATWCWEEERRVSNDGVIAYRNRRLSLKLRHDMPERARVLVRTSQDGTLRVVYRAKTGAEHQLRWQDHVQAEPLYKAKGRAPWAESSRPQSNHPWRTSNMIFSVNHER
ncbi:MAG: ISNCY family transposase [Gemmatimonadaceae bacterium]